MCGVQRFSRGDLPYLVHKIARTPYRQQYSNETLGWAVMVPKDSDTGRRLFSPSCHVDLPREDQHPVPQLPPVEGRTQSSAERSSSSGTALTANMPCKYDDRQRRVEGSRRGGCGQGFKAGTRLPSQQYRHADNLSAVRVCYLMVYGAGPSTSVFGTRKQL